MDRRIVSVDWVSRLFSIVGVLGTLGIGLYLYNGTHGPGLDDAAIAKVVDDRLAANSTSQKQAVDAVVTASVTEEYDRRYNEQIAELKTLNQRANEGQSRFDEDARNALADFDRAAEDERLKRSNAFADLLVELRAKIDDSEQASIAFDPPRNGSNNDSETDSETNADDALLRVAKLALRPVSGSDGSEIAIHNDGGLPATITSVTFLPTANYKPGPDAATDNSLLVDSTVVVFDTDDNRATVTGEHKDYMKLLAQPVTIPSGKTMIVRLEIDNAKHIGWGFEGTASFTYEDGTLKVENARSRFVDKSAGSP